jgi:methanogenic corrinoid protein MtbC1/DNA-binding XRE family transcriptional regulator
MARRAVQINPAQVKARYLRALLAGDLNEASDAVARLVAGRVGLADIYLGVLAPAMVTIGDLWCEGKINVAQEHLATQTTLGQMEKLRLMQSIPRPVPYHVMVTCVEGEGHYLGARMLADLFQLEGWSVDFLGPDVPNRALIEIVEARQPNLLCVSVTLEINLKATRILLKGLNTISERPKILLGGFIGGTLRNWKSEFDGVEVANSLVEGIKLARKFFKPVLPTVLLGDVLKELGRRIRALRNQNRWTQEDLAKATKLTRAYLVAVEGGRQNPSLDVVIRIANALNVPPEQLISREEKLN